MNKKSLIVVSVIGLGLYAEHKLTKKNNPSKDSVFEKVTNTVSEVMDDIGISVVPVYHITPMYTVRVNRRK